MMEGPGPPSNYASLRLARIGECRLDPQSSPALELARDTHRTLLFRSAAAGTFNGRDRPRGWR